MDGLELWEEAAGGGAASSGTSRVRGTNLREIPGSLKSPAILLKRIAYVSLTKSRFENL